MLRNQKNFRFTQNHAFGPFLTIFVHFCPMLSHTTIYWPLRPCKFQKKLMSQFRENFNKASQKSDMPITIIHENADIFANFLAESLKGDIKTYNFPNCVKLADITPLHKKWREDNKENYRQLSILPTSKILERIIFEHVSTYFDNFLSDQQCRFRKGYSTQHCLLNLLKRQIFSSFYGSLRGISLS